MPNHKDSLGGETLDGEKQQDPAEQTRLEELLDEALVHEQTFDYEAGLQTLAQVAPSLKQTTVSDRNDTAEEITTRLTTKQSRLKELEGIVREGITNRKITGLLIIVEELLALRPDRPEVQKLKERLDKRWRTPINELFAEGNAKGVLVELEKLKTHGLTEEQSTLYDSTKAMIAAETELITLVKKANTDGIIDRSEVAELFPQALQCLALNPNNSSVLKLKNDLLDRIQNDINGFVNLLPAFPWDVFTYLPPELLTTYKEQNPNAICTLKNVVEFLADPDYVVLHEHKWIDLDAAEALAQHTSEHELDLNGLTSISVEVAGALARCQTGLCLNGLTNISVEMAEALAKHTTGLCLFGLTSISVEVAATLAAHRGLLNLGGLTSLSDAAADALEVHGNVFVGTNLTIETVRRFETINLAIAERFLASPHQPSFFFKYKWIDLDAAEALAKHTAGLFLSGLTSISVEVAEALAKHTSDEGLELNELTSISVEVAEALAKHPDGLFLSGLTSISVEVAEALAKCSYLDIPLDSLPPAAAQILRDAGHGE